MQRTLFSGLAATVLLAIAIVLPASAANGNNLMVSVTGLMNNQQSAGTLDISRFDTSGLTVVAGGTDLFNR